MKKRSRQLRGLEAYFNRERRPQFKYISSSDEEENSATASTPSSSSALKLSQTNPNLNVDTCSSKSSSPSTNSTDSTKIEPSLEITFVEPEASKPKRQRLRSELNL